MAEFKDNRIRIIYDENRIRVWELIELENPTADSAMMILCRHLARGEEYISPDLPDDPTDELTVEQIAEIKGSEAYKTLRRFTVPEINLAIQTMAGASVEKDPN